MVRGWYVIWCLLVCSFIDKGSACYAQIRLPNDSVIQKPVIPQSIKREILRNDTAQTKDNVRQERYIAPTNVVDSLRTRKMLDSLKSYSEKRKVTSHLYKLLFVSQSSGQQNYQGEENVNSFVNYEGKPIKSITYRKLEIFGVSIFDRSTWDSEEARQFIGNKLTIPTRTFILKRLLLQQEGDALDPTLLAESERLLRASANVQDARILVRKNSDGSVSLFVVTQDVFPIRPLAEIGSLQSGKLGLEDRNFLGYGHELSMAVPFNFQDSVNIGFNIGYQAKNILGSFVDAELRFEDDAVRLEKSAEVRREFLTPRLRWAGAVYHQEVIQKGQVINLLDTLEGPIHFVNNEAWAGHSFNIQGDDLDAIRLYLTGRFAERHFFERPFVAPDSNRIFINGRVFLGGLSLNKQSYYKSNLIRAFGQTEDIPVGWKLSLLRGYQWLEFDQGTLYQAEASKSWYAPHKGYHYASVTGSLNTDYQEVNNYAVGANYKYISPLVPLGGFHWRNFFEASFSQLFGYQGLLALGLDREQDVRGLNVPGLLGDRKIVFKYESVFFSPWQLVGFKMAFFSFADVANIRGATDVEDPRDVYNSIGGGIRLRNENLIFNTMQLRIGVHIDPPSGIAPLSIDFSTRTIVNWDNFQIRKPKVNFFE